MAKRMFAVTIERNRSGSHALRWLLLPPLSVGGALAAYLAVALTCHVLVYAAVGPAAAWSAAPASFAASFAMAYAFVATGVWVAPARRGAVAQVLIGLGAALAAIALSDNASAIEPVSWLAVDAADSPVSSIGVLAGLAAVALRLRSAR